MKKVLLSISVIALLISVGCNSKHNKEHHENAKFLVTTPLKKDTIISKDYVCQIRSIQHIELRALEKGYLQNIYVDEGQFVKKGQLLFQIMPAMYQAELQKAQAEANFAEIEYQNTKVLADSNIVSANELALAKAKLQKAQAEMSMAQVHLDFTSIKAPFDGIVGRFHVRLGSLLDEGELLTELSDNSQMWVYFNMPEAEYLDYKTEIKKDSLQQVYLLMANNKPFEHPGVIETIESDFNNETGNIAFRANFSNPKKLLRHGETGSIQIPETHKGALIIPQKATFEILDYQYVFVVDKNNIIQSRKITIEEELPHLYIIKDGLSVNDKILIEGLRKVNNKDKIVYDFVKPEEVLSHLDLYAE
ncbi:MAG: efflux RND transporter periplasmic adaptor subunit [Vicingus serpentipes]|nr:efflux RND transporter periplasmic adaptor subunit [Vicingus serpentipes]